MPASKIAQLNIRIPAALKQEVKAYCAQLGVKVQVFVVEAIERHLHSIKDQKIEGINR